MVFEQHPHSFSSDYAKVNYIIGLLRGDALTWAQAISSQSGLQSLTFNDLESQLKVVFDHPNYAFYATDRLVTILQGELSVAQYTIEFWTLAAEAGWNEPPLMGVFRLNQQL